MIASTGVLIDDRGEIWADHSPQLLRRLGRRELGFNLVSYVVRNLGFIHLRPTSGSSICASINAGAFNHDAMISAIYWIVDRRPDRIMVSTLSAEQVSHRIFSDIGLFTGYLERLAAGEQTVPGRLFAFPLDQTALRSQRYAPIRPMLKYWRASGGRLDEDFFAIFRERFFQERGTLVRMSPASPRLTIEHFGIGIRTMPPCEALRMVGRDMGDMGDAHDSEYSSWAARSFAEAAASEQPRIESIRARINISSGAAMNAGYHRVLLPWRRGTETLVLGMSILRERSLVA